MIWSILWIVFWVLLGVVLSGTLRALPVISALPKY